MIKKNLYKSPIIKTITRFIIPYICLYSLYIQVNGEISPGGGFQAGVIFASAIIAADLVYSKNLMHFSIGFLRIIAVIGVMIYTGVGFIPLIFDSYYLDYSVLANDKFLAQTIGIFTIELGVGLTVAAVMYLIYFILQETQN